MQIISENYNIQDHEQNIQNFAPLIEKLSPIERFALVKLIMNMPISVELKTVKSSENHHTAQQRFNRFPKAITISDDFWFSKTTSHDQEFNLSHG